MTQSDERHARLIEVHQAHGEELGQSKTFTVARCLQGEILGELKPRSILFIGPGHGDEAQAVLAGAGIGPESIKIIGCDLNSYRLERFKARFPHAEIFCGAVLDPEFKIFLERIGRVDLVQMGFVLHDHTEAEKPLLLNAAWSFLNNGGHIMAADPTLPRYPNYLPRIPDAAALAEVQDGLKNYFNTYIDEVRSWQIDPIRREELLESLQKGLQDALRHEDGREAFDTPEMYCSRFKEAGFEGLVCREGYNTVIVVKGLRNSFSRKGC
jgi:hypothetical protein